jgi:hypothetical protein
MLSQEHFQKNYVEPKAFSLLYKENDVVKIHIKLCPLLLPTSSQTKFIISLFRIFKSIELIQYKIMNSYRFNR